MKLDRNCPVKKEQLEEYNSFLERIQNLIDETEVPNLICVLLQAGFEVRENKEFFSTSKLNIFTGELLSKAINEGWALIGCLERAAYLSVYHHTRSTLELTALYHWVTYKPDKIEKRIEKYFEYKELLHYQLYLRFAESKYKPLSDNLKSTSQEQLEKYKSKEDYWIKLFEPKDNNILKVRNWHNKTSIENILEEFPVEKLKLFYEEFSHATHFSPITQSLGTDDTILGLPVGEDGNKFEVNKHMTIYLDSLEPLMSFIQNATGFDSKIKFPRAQ